jgi:urea carboxylase system permease
MLIGYIVSVSAIAIALQTVLPSVWSGFQVISGSSALSSKSGATNAILIGTIVIVISTVIGNIGVGIMSRITRIGVTCELLGVALLIVLFFVHAKRGPSAVFHTNGVAGHGSYIWPFLISALMACYVMYGFDSAGELSEETRNPRKAAPQGIIRAMLASGIGGALLLVGALLAAPSLLSPKLGTEGLAYVIQSRLGTGLGKVLLIDVSIAILSAALAIQASASRVMFSMARDGRLPFSPQLAHVSAKRGTPAAPNIVVGALAIALLVVNLGQSALFTDITGVAVVVVYLAYLGVTVPRLVSRFKPGFAERERNSGTQFSLGRLGLPLNIIAVGFGAFFLVDIGWPRAIVYGTSGYLHYFSLIFVGGCAVIGIMSYVRIKQRDRAFVTEAVEGIDIRMDPA